MRGQRTEDRGQVSGLRSQVSGFRSQVSGLRSQVSEAHGRRGVTLLEVLISIFVMAVGLMGVAALIPIGTFAVSETAKADRSAAMGRAAIHEVRVREMLQRWRDDGAARWRHADFSVITEPVRRQYLIGQPFAIDPLFACEAATQSNTGDFNFFPFHDSGGPIPLGSRLARLRLDIFEIVISDPQQLAVFNRIFAGQDDLIFDIDEDDPDRRPRQSCLWDDGAVAPYETPSGSGPYPLHAQAADNYSWMLTAVPDPNELPNIPDDPPAQLQALAAHRQQTYEISIVTFYKRDFNCDATTDPPSERFVEITFTGTGIGGGDAMLTAPPMDANGDQMTQGLAEEYLKVRENQWIMVTAFVPDSRLVDVSSGYRRIAKWYRVIRLDDEVVGSAPNFTRNITLAGPDLEPSFAGRATLIDGVIGVYTTTVTLE